MKIYELAGSEELDREAMSKIGGGSIKIIDYGAGFKWVITSETTWACGPGVCVDATDVDVYPPH